jgi:hypothetical protein
MSSELCSRTTPPSPQVQRMGLLTITTLCRWDGKTSVAGRLAVRAGQSDRSLGMGKSGHLEHAE